MRLNFLLLFIPLIINVTIEVQAESEIEFNTWNQRITQPSHRIPRPIPKPSLVKTWEPQTTSVKPEIWSTTSFQPLVPERTPKPDDTSSRPAIVEHPESTTKANSYGSKTVPEEDSEPSISYPEQEIVQPPTNPDIYPPEPEEPEREPATVSTSTTTTTTTMRPPTVEPAPEPTVPPRIEPLVSNRPHHYIPYPTPALPTAAIVTVPPPPPPRPTIVIPTHKPEVPTHKPEVPTHKPYVPTQKPDVPTHKPEVPTHKPYIPTYKPTIPTLPPKIDENKQILLDYNCKKINGYYAYANECDAYVECKKNIASRNLCPDGLHFNPNALWPEYPCAYPAEVKCDSTSVMRPHQPTSQCPRQYGYFPMNNGDCSTYLMCQEGIARTMNCPPGLAFNSDKSSCDWPENMPSCNLNVFQGFDCPAPPLDEYGEPSDEILKYRYGQSCKEYVACQRGHPRLLSCDPGLYFDEASEACIDSDYVNDCRAV